MADLMLRILAGLGALMLLAVAVFSALWAWTRHREAAKPPLPDSDLPAIPPEDYQTLWNDFEAWERGERP